MKIKIIRGKKIKDKFILEGINEYAKRLGKYCRVELKIGVNIHKEIKDTAYIFKIGQSGESISSDQLAGKIEALGIGGTSDMIFVFEDEYAKVKADFALNISNMDIDRNLMLIILYKQIYRAYRIINNEPYHK
ncbi:MAG: 23S rRNA (pseudouridine(1915)-N(3))-methyltransferase RlmH [Clostridiales bacterium]|nr:23S rRNA (pseudouridine(1915)-N(3))-methyltransferase RlmH [Clostridiales bacterium]